MKDEMILMSSFFDKLGKKMTYYLIVKQTSEERYSFRFKEYFISFTGDGNRYKEKRLMSKDILLTSGVVLKEEEFEELKKNMPKSNMNEQTIDINEEEKNIELIREDILKRIGEVRKNFETDLVSNLDDEFGLLFDENEESLLDYLEIKEDPLGLLIYFLIEINDEIEIKEEEFRELYENIKNYYEHNEKEEALEFYLKENTVYELKRTYGKKYDSYGDLIYYVLGEIGEETKTNSGLVVKSLVKEKNESEVYKRIENVISIKDRTGREYILSFIEKNDHMGKLETFSNGFGSDLFKFFFDHYKSVNINLCIREKFRDFEFLDTGFSIGRTGSLDYLNN